MACGCQGKTAEERQAERAKRIQDRIDAREKIKAIKAEQLAARQART